MSGWDVTDMAEALPGAVLETVPPTEGAVAEPEGVTTNDDAAPEDKRDPQAFGWAQKQSYDYDEYNKSTKELLDETPGEGASSVRDWASNAAKYEWSDEYGDVGPHFPELEKQLFGSEYHVRAGIQFEK
jgi:ATP-dependent RNA helicase DDX3X